MAEFLVKTEETGGAFSLLKSTVAGDSAPPHYHQETTEVFFMVEGSMRVTVDGVERTLGRHDSLHIPPKAVHSFTMEDGQLLVLMAPGNLELMWHDIEERQAEGTFPEEIDRVEDLMEPLSHDHDLHAPPVAETGE